jgi:DNA topoisomerase-1
MAKKTSSPDGGKKLVIVESPTKAKTIRKFLGKDYIVESCMGHIRDLPQSAKDIPEKVKKEKWASLGVNVDKNFEPLYCIPKDKLKVVKNLKEKLSEADELFLATDEDREGESISWHLTEVLKPDVPTKRMVFHEITKDAIQKALTNTRSIDQNLVSAQEARRILDRLVGYTVSPLLWKKVAYGLSAGRVQSVAVRLIAEKELDRLKFKKAQYSGVQAEFEKEAIRFEGKLFQLQGKRVATGKDFDGDTGQLLDGKEVIVLNPEQAQKSIDSIKGLPFKVSEVDEKPVFRKPAPPFITSTLQQEANRKLGLSSRETMQVAQKLYEQGYITYMRTDSIFLSQEAIQAARKCIKSLYGNDYLMKEPRSYAAKQVKGAQEAHEAIRPAGTEFQTPEMTDLSGIQFKLYDLIWKRTVASQMPDSKQKQVSAKIVSGDKVFSVSGMTIEFPGFLRAYVEGSDDPDAELQEREVKLPPLKAEEAVKCLNLETTAHETKPPARYTEASLVQKMEKEGIGRPSTYASIIGTIIDRGYVKKQGSALAPTFTAMVVAKLLRNHLSQFVDLGFTSEMEKSLDHIAEGDLDSEKYLTSIYFGNRGLKNLVESQESKIDPNEARSITLEGLEKFSFRVGKYGAYVCTEKDGEEICASIPDSESPADMTAESAIKLIDQKINGADALGKDPKTGKPIYALNGRFGPYVQLGEVTSEDDKPKRVSIPPNIPIETVDLKQALELLSLPKTLGVHPRLNKEIKAGLGRFGPYVVCEGDYRSIPKGESIFTISLARSIELLDQPKKGRGKAAPLKTFGPHPVSEDEIQLLNGPYGPYVKCGKVNVSLPEDMRPEDLSVEKAMELLADRMEAKSKTKSKPKSKTAKVVEPKNAAAAIKATATKNKKAANRALANSQFPEIVKAKSGSSQGGLKTVIRKSASK